MAVAEIRRCEACGQLIALVHWPPYGIHLDQAWVHVNRFGRIKRRVKHAPVVTDG